MRLFDAGKQEGQPEEVSSAILTIPNVLSLLRLLSLPVVYHYLTTDRLGLGLLLGFIFGATDWVDGYVARRFNQVTKLGKLLDPFSDRIFIVVVGFAMVVAELIPLWAVLIVLARDAAILLGGLAMLGRGIQPPAVTRVGKAATFGLMWSFPAFILSGFWGGTVADPQMLLRLMAWSMFFSALVLYYLAAWQYAVSVRGQLSSR
ncbi:MAG: cardiolipin synthase [Glaciecola sp.]